jgi:hypothetical protein
LQRLFTHDDDIPGVMEGRDEKENKGRLKGGGRERGRERAFVYVCLREAGSESEREEGALRLPRLSIFPCRPCLHLLDRN